MKIYSKSTLVITLIVGAIFIINGIKHEPVSLFRIIIGIYIIVQGFYVALTKEGYDEDKLKAKLGKEIYREKFGSFGIFVPYTPIMILLLACLIALIFKVTTIIKIIVAILMIIAVIFSICLAWWYQKELNKRYSEEINKKQG